MKKKEFSNAFIEANIMFLIFVIIVSWFATLFAIISLAVMYSYYYLLFLIPFLYLTMFFIIYFCYDYGGII